jgi:hypothetical protein
VGLWRPLPAPFAGMGAHCSSASAIRCLARCLARCGRTFVVAQGARARLRDLALRLSILRRIPSRQAATGCPFRGREYGRWTTRLG